MVRLDKQLQQLSLCRWTDGWRDWEAQPVRKLGAQPRGSHPPAVPARAMLALALRRTRPIWTEMAGTSQNWMELVGTDRHMGS